MSEHPSSFFGERIWIVARPVVGNLGSRRPSPRPPDCRRLASFSVPLYCSRSSGYHHALPRKRGVQVQVLRCFLMGDQRGSSSHEMMSSFSELRSPAKESNYGPEPSHLLVSMLWGNQIRRNENVKLFYLDNAPITGKTKVLVWRCFVYRVPQ